MLDIDKNFDAVFNAINQAADDLAQSAYQTACSFVSHTNTTNYIVVVLPVELPKITNYLER